MSNRRILLLLGCAVCLLVLASALPAADPRLDAPGFGSGSGNGTEAGSWDSVVGSSDDTPTESARGADQNDGTGGDSDRDDDGDTTPGGSTPELDVRGSAEPGSEVRVTVDDGDPFPEDYRVLVDGAPVGETRRSSRNVTVPYATEMTVAVPELSLSETVDVETTATLEAVDPVAGNRNVTVAVAVGSTPVPEAALTRDGQRVGTTDEDGEVTVRMPERVGTTELGVRREPVAGNATLELPAPEIEVVSPVLLPGAPAPVKVTADGVGVPDVTVSAAGGGSATTGDDGTARVRLPIDDEATITTEIDGERAATTVGNLYLRLTVAAVLVPGLVVGGVWTYLRLVARREGDGLFGRRGRIDVSTLFVGLADWLAGVIDSLRRPSVPSLPSPPSTGWLSGVFRRPSVSWPSLSLPRPSAPSIGLSGLFGSSGRSGPDRSIRSRLGFGSDGEPEEERQASGPALADEPLGPPGPRQEVRALWHAFLDRLDVRRRQTRTAGQVARRALAAGFPASEVRRLLGVFREVEYGGREPSSERVSEARAATETLLDDDADEEGSE